MKQDEGPLSPDKMWLVLAAAALLFFGYKQLRSAAPASEGVAILRIEDSASPRSERVNERECKANPDRIWAQAGDPVECIAYVVVRGQEHPETTVVFFNGDVPRSELGKETTPLARQNAEQLAQQMADRYGLTTVVVGRPGLLGSTGFHQPGGMRDDAYLINNALDQLRDRLGVRRFAIAGQSGGARLIAQLMVLGRTDISCAAMASGAYDTPRLKGGGIVRTNIFGAPGHRYLVPVHEVGKLPEQRTRRLFVIGDPDDSIAPFDEQRAWSEKLGSHGHNVLLIEARGRGTNHHGLSHAALSAAALCAKGGSDVDIKAAMPPRR